MGVLQALGLAPRSEAEKVREERISRARENLEKAREDLARIPWGSDTERRISQAERDETLQVVRNKRIAARAQERTWEALLEGVDLDGQQTDAAANITLVRGFLRH